MLKMIVQLQLLIQILQAIQLWLLTFTPSSTSSKIFIQIQPQLLAQSSGSAEAGLGFGISREIDDANNTTVI